MPICRSCGTPLPENAKFCPVCGASAADAAPDVPALVLDTPVEEQPETEAQAAPEAPSAESAPGAGWYQSAETQQQSYAAAPVYVAPAKPSIGSVFDFYRKALAVLAKKPVRLWGLSLLYLLIACIISGLGSFVPLISLPIVLVLGLGFTGILLDGYHGKEVRSEQLFRPFRKEEIVRNGAGMCWMELWTLIWGFVPIMNIIKYYSYCFTPYILATDKEIGATEALRKSMRMTDGYKAKLFWADILLSLGSSLVIIILALLSQISYIGWIFAIVLVLVYLAVILFLPIFIGLVHTAFFEEISKVHEE